jgi:FkbM family methyltransferase
MRLRARAKKLLFGSMPGLRGRFPYFGHSVYFPPRSTLFEAACAEGIYERTTLDLILSLVKPATTYFDIGANIGLMSVPVLATRPEVKIVSVEASPIALDCLRRTHAAAPRREDWKIVGVAVGNGSGETEFWSAGGGQDAFSGIRDTGRGGPKQSLKVPLRTIDEIWRSCGSPPVSVVKLDIEGGESLALAGASACVGTTKAALVIEWAEQNLQAYDLRPEHLLQLCGTLGYAAYASPSLTRVDTLGILTATMAQTYVFLLLPLD